MFYIARKDATFKSLDNDKSIEELRNQGYSITEVSEEKYVFWSSHLIDYMTTKEALELTGLKNQTSLIKYNIGHHNKDGLNYWKYSELLELTPEKRRVNYLKFDFDIPDQLDLEARNKLVRKYRAEGATLKELSTAFGKSRTTIANICRGFKINKDNAIRSLYKKGFPSAQIRRRLQITNAEIFEYLNH